MAGKSNGKRGAGNDGNKKKKKAMVTRVVEGPIANGTPSSYVLATVNQNGVTTSNGPMTHPVLSGTRNKKDLFIADWHAAPYF
jgi:hypothetical protein